MNRHPSLACLFVALLGCSSKPTTPATNDAVEAAPVAVTDDDVLDEDIDGTDRILMADADQRFASWLAAQNSGNLDAYLAHYAPAFKGVRRTSDGNAKELDLAGWKADRKKMFGAKMKVQADAESIDFDDDGRVTYRFVQRFQAGKYADHGVKVVATDAQGLIVREEMIWSRPGWDDAAGDPIDASLMTGPITLRFTATSGAPNGDCSFVKLALQLEDATGAKSSVTIGEVISGEVDEPAGVVTAIAPEKKGKALYAAGGAYCAGLGNEFTVRRVGDTIEAVEKFDDEEAGSGTTRTVAVTLPAGVEITAR